MIGAPKIDNRQERQYLGIRSRVPFKGMSSHVAELFEEIQTWAAKNDVSASGPRFLRYHVIDMDGELDVEVGIPVSPAHEGDTRVRPGVLPAGRYASLVFTGSGYAGNKALVDWAESQGIRWDRWDDPRGDAFRSRYESYLTDPKVEPRMELWEIEVAIKLSDAQEDP